MSERPHTATKVELVEARRGGDWYQEKYAEVLDQRNALLDALRELLGSEVYADAEGMLSIERGGYDDTDHREIVAKARRAIEKVKGARHAGSLRRVQHTDLRGTLRRHRSRDAEYGDYEGCARTRPALGSAPRPQEGRGTMSTCSTMKYSGGGFRGYRCTNSAKMHHEGKGYCGVHDPVKKAAQKAARIDKSNAKWKAITRGDRERQHKLDTWDALVAACELAAEHEECVCEDKGECLGCVLQAALKEAKS